MPLFRAASAPRSVHHGGGASSTSAVAGGSGAASSSSNVCYGGPLGALLSISAPSSRRDSFRHANSLGGGSLGALVVGAGVQPTSQRYFTPQSSRRQSQHQQQPPSSTSSYSSASSRLLPSKSTESVDSYDSGRGSSQGIYSSSAAAAAAAAGDSSPSTAAAATTSGSTTGLSRSRPGSYHGSVAAAAAADPAVASNTASSVSSAAVDYKRLYEKERANSERLGAENSRLREENEQLKRQASEQRQVDKRLSEYEAQNRAPARDTDPVDECETLRSELERLRADNLSLIRVLSRLKPQQQQQNAS